MTAIPNLKVFKADGSFALETPVYVNDYVLTAGTAKTVSVPANARYAFISANGDIWANFSGGTAAIPVADITDGSGSELNPTVRYMHAALSSFSLISAANALVSIAWYQ